MRRNNLAASRFNPMVEVFKTDVKDPEQAKKILKQIHGNFAGYKANFDLDDCDRILRVRFAEVSMETSSMVRFLKKLGVYAEILAD
ncbi:MAG: hypothetical protein ACJ75J_03640 [Cytophagaceae bacterium]